MAARLATVAHMEERDWARLRDRIVAQALVMIRAAAREMETATCAEAAVLCGRIARLADLTHALPLRDVVGSPDLDFLTPHLAELGLEHTAAAEHLRRTR